MNKMNIVDQYDILHCAKDVLLGSLRGFVSSEDFNAVLDRLNVKDISSYLEEEELAELILKHLPIEWKRGPCPLCNQLSQSHELITNKPLGWTDVGLARHLHGSHSSRKCPMVRAYGIILRNIKAVDSERWS